MKNCNACYEVSQVTDLSGTPDQKTNKCMQCARRESAELYNIASFKAAIEMGKYVILNGQHEGRLLSEEYLKRLNHALTLVKEVPALSIKEAKANGEVVYFSFTPCQEKGHLGVRTLDDRCYYCFLDSKPSPRQAALAEGKKWYTPDKPCKHCGYIAERRVNNGDCRGGNTPHMDWRKTPESILMATRPNSIISKKWALDNGLKVYRTGSECKMGHAGFRYVSTSNCVQCMKLSVKFNRQSALKKHSKES